MRKTIRSLTALLSSTILASAQCIDCGVSPEIGGSPTQLKSLIMVQVGSSTNVSTAAATFAPGNSGASIGFGTIAAGKQYIMPITGTVKLLSEYRSGATSSNPFSLAVMKNGSLGNEQCAETVNLTGSGIGSCQDTTNMDSFVAGDKFGFQLCPGTFSSGSCNLVAPVGGLQNLMATAVFSSFSGEVPLLGYTGSNWVANDFSGFNSSVSPSATENIVSAIMPTAGHIDNLYVSVVTAISGVNQLTGTIFHETAGNCSTPATTSLTTTLTGGATQNSDTTPADGFDVAAGDCVSIKWTTSGSPTASLGSFGVRFVPTVATESLITEASLGNNSTASASRFYPPVGNCASLGCNAAETADFLYLPPSLAGVLSSVTFSKFITLNDGAATGSQTRTFHMRSCSNSAGVFGSCGNFTTDITCTQNSTNANGCSDSTHSFTPSLGLFIDVNAINGSTSVGSGTLSKYGIVTTIP